MRAHHPVLLGLNFSPHRGGSSWSISHAAFSTAAEVRQPLACPFGALTVPPNQALTG
jgi:hypothetical protein